MNPKTESGFFRLVFLVLVLLPVVVWPLGTTYAGPALSVLSFCLIYLIASQALNLQVGYTDLLNLGPVAFVGIGGYTAAILLHIPSAGGEGVSPSALVAFWQGVTPDLQESALRWPLFFVDPNFLAYLTVTPIAMAVAGLGAVLIGVPTLRLRGDYFAIVTLGLAQILQLFVRNEDWLTDGSKGIGELPTVLSFAIGDAGSPFALKTGHYFLGLMFLALSLWIMIRLRDSRIGRAFMAIRDDELAAQSNGIQLSYYRMMSFTISAMICALAGVALVARVRFISPSDLMFWESILYLCCIVLGGLGSVRGALIGALIIGGAGELMRIGITHLPPGWNVPAQLRYILFGVILIAVMRFRPEGLHSAAQEEIERGESEVGLHRDVKPTLFAIGEKA